MAKRLMAGAAAVLAGLCLVLALRSSLPRWGDRDFLLPGSQWHGYFDFEPAGNGSGSVSLQIRERQGDTFRGSYVTEGGKWGWLVKGTLRGTMITWEFTDVVHEQEPRNVVGAAHVEGRCQNNQIEATLSRCRLDGAVTLAAAELRQGCPLR
jgi:hypothetical protein